MATNLTLAQLKRRAELRKEHMEVLAARLDRWYKRALKATCPVKRREIMIKGEEIRQDLQYARMRYDETMVELYGTAHKRVAR